MFACKSSHTNLAETLQPPVERYLITHTKTLNIVKILQVTDCRVPTFDTNRIFEMIAVQILSIIDKMLSIALGASTCTLNSNKLPKSVITDK